MLNPLFACLSSFLLSLAFLPFIIRFSKKKKVLSHPGRRRIHKKITPSLGGVAIFFGFSISCMCWAFIPGPSILFRLLPILIIPFIIGLFDDLIQLTPSAKLIAQVITASLIYFVADLHITSTYGLGGNILLPLTVSYLATVITVIIVTNSLNLIDGIDGLAASFSFIACMTFGSWFYFTADYPYAILCLSLAGAILAFLFQNWEPSNIFMGDTGSLVIGTVLAVVAIHFANENFSLANSNPLKFSSSAGTALCILILPLADTTRIILIRLSQGRSPFTADKRHIHHTLVRLGLSHRQTVYVLILVQVAMIALAILLRDENQWILIASTVLITAALCIVLDRKISNALRKEQS